MIIILFLYLFIGLIYSVYCIRYWSLYPDDLLGYIIKFLFFLCIAFIWPKELYDEIKGL